MYINLFSIDRKIWYFIILTLALASCTHRDLLMYETRAQQILDDNKLEWSQIVVIPGEGCGGCISGATFFITSNQANLTDVAVIFTGVNDKKLLRQQVGRDFLDKKNIFIDNSNLLMNKEVLSVYPYILALENGAITSKMEFEENLVNLKDRLDLH